MFDGFVLILNRIDGFLPAGMTICPIGRRWDTGLSRFETNSVLIECDCMSSKGLLITICSFW